MTFYAIILAIILLISLIGWANKRLELTSYIAIWCILFTVMAFRGRYVGTDTYTYVGLYIRGGQLPLTAAINNIDSAQFYNVYSWILYRAFPKHENAILIFNSLIIHLCLSNFIYRFSDNKLFTTLLYVLSYSWLTSFNIMRQAVAVAIVLESFCLMYDDRRLLATISVVLAAFIHSTAIITVIIIIIANLIANRSNIGIRVIAYSTLSILLAAILFREVSSIVIKLLPRYAMYFSDNGILDRYATSTNRTRILWLIYLSVLMVISRMGITRSYYNSSIIQRTIYNIAILTTIIGTILGTSSLFIRIAATLSVAVCLCISDSVKLLDQDKHTVIMQTLTLAMFTCMYIAYLRGNYGDVIPYTTWS